MIKGSNIEKSEKEVSLTKFTPDKLLSFGISKDVNLEAASALKDPAIETNSGHEKAEIHESLFPLLQLFQAQEKAHKWL